MDRNQAVEERAPSRRIFERLENWGRWARVRAPNSPSRSSPLYRLYRENSPDFVSGKEPLRETDPEDAYMVDKSIGRVCLRYQRELLKLYFVAHQRVAVICRKVGITRYSFNSELQGIERKLEIDLEEAYTNGNQEMSQ